MRRVIVSLTAVGVALASLPVAAPARAQEPAPGRVLPEIHTDQPPGSGRERQAQTRMNAELERLIGTQAVTTRGRPVGSIENLLIAPDGTIRAVVLEWGGVLGIGARRAAIPVDRVAMAPNGDHAVIDMTRQQLEAAPYYDPDTPAAAGIDPDIKPLR